MATSQRPAVRQRQRRVAPRRRARRDARVRTGELRLRMLRCGAAFEPHRRNANSAEAASTALARALRSLPAPALRVRNAAGQTLTDIAMDGAGLSSVGRFVRRRLSLESKIDFCCN